MFTNDWCYHSNNWVDLTLEKRARRLRSRHWKLLNLTEKSLYVEQYSTWNFSIDIRDKVPKAITVHNWHRQDTRDNQVLNSWLSVQLLTGSMCNVSMKIREQAPEESKPRHIISRQRWRPRQLIARPRHQKLYWNKAAQHCYLHVLVRLTLVHQHWYKSDSQNLKRGGSIGSFCTSNMCIVRCFAPELNETLCCWGVYLPNHNTICYMIMYFN